MSMQVEGITNGAVHPGVRYDPESPFVDVYVPQEQEQPLTFPTSVAGLESPFVSEYADEAGGGDLESAELAELLQELQDPEFDDVVGELVEEAAALYAEHLTHVSPLLSETAGQAVVAERSVAEWLAPLQERTEQLVDAVATGAAQQDLTMLGEAELDQWLQGFAPQPDPSAPPVFEHFFRNIFKKVGTFVKGAAKLARKGIAAVGKILPIHRILGGLKGIVRPLLERVLRFAIDRLPASIRPMASKLARQLFSAAHKVLGEDPSHGDVHELQEAFDLEAVALLEARDEAQLEFVLNEAATTAERVEPSSVAELQAARERFVRELSELRPGQDPTPAVQSFLPVVMAALPALRMAISVIGRQRVVDFLAGLLAQLIARYVGQDAARMLSRAIVDTGLGLLTLETAESDSSLGFEAIAATVEDTVRELGQLSPEAVEDPVRLEAEARLAFNRAAAANFPPAMLRRDLVERESSTVDGTWVRMPRRGRRAWYRKYTKVFDATVTPEIARSIRTFGGATLEQALRDQRRVSLPVRARVHLYEAIPGTWLSRITLHEKDVAGLGTHSRAAWSQIHPLTVAAAGTLFQQPGLGRDPGSRWLQSRHRITVGQRFYYLELRDGAPPTPTPARLSEVNLTIDARQGRNRIVVAVFLSEREAQELAPRLKNREITAAMALIKATVDAGVRSMRSPDSRHVRILTEAPAPEQLVPALAAAGAGAIAARIGEKALDWLIDKVLDLVWAALTEWFQRKADTFATAVQDSADGATIVITMEAPVLVRIVRDAASGRSPSMLDLARLVVPVASMLPGMSVRAIAGFTRG